MHTFSLLLYKVILSKMLTLNLLSILFSFRTNSCFPTVCNSILKFQQRNFRLPIITSYTDPPSSPVLSTSLSTLSASECRSVSVSWLAPATDRTLTQFYLYRDNSLISTLSNTTTQYTDTDPLILNAAYLYSLAVASCAGNSTMSNSTINIPGKII